MSESILQLSRASVPRKSERIAARSVDGKAVVVVLDARKLHTLNVVGTRVFELCDGTRNLASIAAEIASELDVSAEIVERDTITFLTKMIDEGAIEIAGAGDSR